MLALLYLGTHKNLDRNVVVRILVVVHHLSPCHSNLVFNFRFDVAEVVRVFWSDFTRIVASVVSLPVALSGSSCILNNLFWLLLDHCNLLYSILVSRGILFAIHVSCYWLLVKHL
jgi:hypothetical protein